MPIFYSLLSLLLYYLQIPLLFTNCLILIFRQLENKSHKEKKKDIKYLFVSTYPSFESLKISFCTQPHHVINESSQLAKHHKANRHSHTVHENENISISSKLYNDNDVKNDWNSQVKNCQQQCRQLKQHATLPYLIPDTLQFMLQVTSITMT